MTTETPSRNSSLRGLLRHASIYSVVPIVQRVLSFLLLKLYTRKLDTAQYGVLGLTDLVILLVPQIVGVNLLGGMTRFYFEHTKEKDRRAVVSSTTLALSGLSWAVVGLALFFREPLATLLFVRSGGAAPAEFTDYLVLALLIIPFSLTSRAGFQYLITLERSAAVATIQLAKTALEIALKLWMLFGLELGVQGFLLSVLIGEVVCAVGLTGWVLWRVGLRFDRRVFDPMFAYALPLIPVGLIQFGLHQADRLLLKMLGPAQTALDQVGVYNHGYKVGFLAHAALLAPFMQIWQPWIFGVRGSQERRREMPRVGTYAVVVLAAVYTPLILFSREVVALISGQESFLAASRVAPWITAAYLFYAVYALSQVTLFVTKRTWPLLWINAAALAVNVGLNAILIPSQGYVGAALATLATFAFLALLGAFAAKRSFTLPFRSAPVAITLAAVLGCVGVALWFDSSELEFLLTFSIRAAVCLAVLLLLWTCVLDAEGRAGLRRLVRERLSSAPTRANGDDEVGGGAG